MKLLSKTELQNDITKDRKLAIDEGMKLARKVDGIRRLALEEERRLTNFGNANKEVVIGQIVQLTQRRGALELEVRDLEERRRVSLEPLDDYSRKLDERAARIKVREAILDDKEEALRATEEALEKDRIGLDIERERVRERRDQAERECENASTLMREAQQQKDDTDAHAWALGVQHVKRERVLSEKEKHLENRETAQAERDAAQDRRERELNARETRLTDMYSTLLRTKKRHG